MSVKYPDPWPHIEGELRQALSGPIEHLVHPEHRTLSTDVGEHWDIPPVDRASLQRRGLPRLSLFTATPQNERAPLVVPNVAGVRGSRILEEDARLYKLGFWGRSEVTGVTAVAPGDGRVFYILPAPITEHDLPEILRPHNRGLYKPAVSLLNSTLTQFIETAWRWHAALQILDTAEEPMHSAPEPELNTHYEHLYACVDLIADAAQRIDPSATADNPSSGWTGLIRANTI
jgi:hypothetical protein